MTAVAPQDISNGFHTKGTFIKMSIQTSKEPILQNNLHFFALVMVLTFKQRFIILCTTTSDWLGLVVLPVGELQASLTSHSVSARRGLFPRSHFSIVIMDY